MHPLPWNIAQGGIDQALALKPRNSDKGSTFDHHGEMRFAAAVVAAVAAVFGAVVDDNELGGRELCGEQPGDFDWARGPFMASHLA